ncbi:MAG: hypothetical protein AAF984_04140, partial [Verrucomicrobiota bacterium]
IRMLERLNKDNLKNMVLSLSLCFLFSYTLCAQIEDASQTMPESEPQNEGIENIPMALPVVETAEDAEAIVVAPLSTEESLDDIEIAYPVTEELQSVQTSIGYDGRPTNPNLPIKVKLLSPVNKEIIPFRDVDVFLDVENYKLAEGGNRLHVILDNQAPVAVHDINTPLSFKDLTQGGHALRLFAVKPNGTTFTNAEAFKTIQFYVVKKDFQNYIDPSAPYITINMPRTGVIDTDDFGRVIFDYRIHNGLFNADMGYKLKFSMGSYEGIIDKPGPIFWSNIPNGKHTLVVELYDSNNRPVYGVFNHVQRQFEIRHVMKAKPIQKENTDEPMYQEEEEPVLIQ